ncbi:MAG: hypothetical protein RLZ55_487 [Actinomycetota bacterium]
MVTSQPTAVVLSGGGAKGAFSAGALDYLVRQLGLVPDVLTGTSAGSLCAGVMAQARGATEFFAVAGQLREDILRMSAPGASFQVKSWLSALEGTSLGDDIEAVVKGKSRPPIPVDPGLAEDPLAGVAASGFTARRGWEDVRSLLTHASAQRKAIKEFAGHNQSLLVLDPLEGALRGRTPGQGPSPIDEERIARPGLRLRIPVTALGAGCSHYVTELGALVDGQGMPVTGGSGTDDPAAPLVPGVIEGMLASSSVPGVFAPRSIGDDVYVDGGILQNIPLSAAQTLGVESCYAVLADPLACPPPTQDYAAADFVQVGLRAEMTVAFYGQQARELQAARAQGMSVTLIDPTVTVVSSFETEPGLLTIALDYGWLRACGVTAATDPSTVARSHAAADEIAAGRVRSWYLEAGLGGSGDAVDKALASAKSMVARALQDWTDMGLALPDKASRWSTDPELHTVG